MEWASAPSITILTVGALLMIGFAFVERRAAEPILPGWIFAAGCSTRPIWRLWGRDADRSDVLHPAVCPGRAWYECAGGWLRAGSLTLGWPLAASVAGRSI